MYTYITILTFLFTSIIFTLRERIWIVLIWIHVFFLASWIWLILTLLFLISSLNYDNQWNFTSFQDISEYSLGWIYFLCLNEKTLSFISDVPVNWLNVSNELDYWLGSNLMLTFYLMVYESLFKQTSLPFFNLQSSILFFLVHYHGNDLDYLCFLSLYLQDSYEWNMRDFISSQFWNIDISIC